MATFTRKEFAEICHKHKAQVTTAIKAGRIIVEPDNVHIDDKNPLNAIIKKKWLDDYIKKQELNTPVLEEKKTKRKSKSLEKLKTTSNSSKTIEDRGDLTLTQQKQIEEIEYKKAARRKIELENAKRRGESIPTELVREIISALGSGFQTAYSTGSESLMNEFMHKHKISGEDSGKMRKKLIDLINESHKEAIDLARVKLQKIVDEISVRLKYENEK